MKQKFGKLSFVHVCKDLPPDMGHFLSDVDAIVDGTYSQKFGGRDIDSYSLFVIRAGKVVDNISWYEEDQLTLLPDQDRDRAEEMIEAYRFRDADDEDAGDEDESD
ncbi:MAG: hypothetical protein ACYTEQ_03510 [Planctomycetota bacterium]|jgi:hypothetical protein